VFDIRNLDKGYEVLPIGEWAGIKDDGAKRIVQPEYNRPATKSGSRCGAPRTRSRPGGGRRQDPEAQGRDQGPKLITPTGKFNVHNTQHDVY
jgi:nitrite reductase (NO-forming)/hydroxylamine reductase